MRDEHRELRVQLNADQIRVENIEQEVENLIRLNNVITEQLRNLRNFNRALKKTLDRNKQKMKKKKDGKRFFDDLFNDQKSEKEESPVKTKRKRKVRKRKQ